jgi:hypothetical protein
MDFTASSPSRSFSSWLNGLWLDLSRSKKDQPKPQVVIYGHDSKAGLQIYRWTKGIDSGCVSGGKLTALILNAKGQQEIVSVGCENHRD